MKLENYSVRELTSEEQLNVNGGGFLAKVWDGICNVAEWIWEHLTLTVQYDSGPVTVSGTIKP